MDTQSKSGTKGIHDLVRGTTRGGERRAGGACVLDDGAARMFHSHLRFLPLTSAFPISLPVSISLPFSSMS